MAHTSQDKSRKPLTSATPLSSAQIDAGWDTGLQAGSEKEKARAPKAYAAPAWMFKAPQSGKRLNPPKLPRPTSKSVPPSSARPSAPAPKSKASSFPPPPSSRRLPAVPTPPRPHAAATTRRAVDAAPIDLRDVPEIDPEIDPEADETLAPASAGSLVPEAGLPADFGGVAPTGAVLGQAPDSSLFAAPTPAVASRAPASLDVLENRESTIAPSSIAPTISDLEVTDFAQRARRNQSTRVLLALALVALVGIGISVGVRGAPPSAAQQSLPMSAAAVAPPTQGGRLEDLIRDRQEPVATVPNSAVQTGSAVVERRVPSVAPATDPAELSTAAPTPSLVPKPPAAGTIRTVKLPRRQRRGAEQAPESATSSAAVQGGASWLVRLQQQEASKASSER